MTEWDFLVALSREAGSKILLDLNNVYVNSQNQNFDPKVFIDSIPEDLIAEIHLAGFSDRGDLLFDTHSNPVFDDVWNLYRYTLQTKNLKETPILIEWDEDIQNLKF